MQLLECIVSKPGLFNTIKLKFDSGLNLVYGRNESGKTMIAKAIMDTLWGEFSGYFSLNGNAWDSLYFEVLFKNSTGRYRFIKNKKELFTVNFANTGEAAFSRESEILKRNSGKIQNDDEAWYVKLYESTNDRETTRLFNKVDIHTFMDISYLPEPINISSNGKSGSNIIQKFLVNDNSNFYTLYENISDAFRNDSPAGSLSNSIFNEILKKESEIKKINKKLQIFDIQSTKSDRVNKEKARLQKEIKNLNEELGKVRSDKTKLLNVQNNLKRMSDIDAVINEKNSEKQTEHAKTESILKLEDYIKNRYPQFHNFEDKNIKNLKIIQETYREVRDVHEEIENFYLIRTEKKNKFKNIILIINISSICVLSALLGISNNALPFQFLNEYKIHYIIGLLTLSISSSLVFLLYFILTSRSNDLKRIMKKKSEVEKKLEDILQKNNITLNEYKLEAIYEYLVKYFEEYGEYSISQTELQNIKESLKADEYTKAVDEEICKLENEQNIIKQEIDNDLKSLNERVLVEINTDKINKLIQGKNYKIKDIKESIAHNKNIMSQIEKEISSTESHTAELKGYNDEKANIQESLSRLNNYKISISYIMNILKEAIGSRENKQIIQLAKVTGSNFHFLTDNQYTGSVNEEIIIKTIKGEMPFVKFNPSIIHLLLLSIKLAVTDNFDDLEINLPLIIDEPFQQMDDQRIERFKKLLDDISLKRQVIVFTRSDNYKDWGSYIEL
jgi:DNA repair exonuclease SbcCD ATPase subunit